MKASKLVNFVSKAEDFTKKNSPAILTSSAVVGLLITIVCAYKAAPKANKILKEKQKDLKDTAPDDKAAKRTVAMEAVKEITPVVLPTLIMGGATTACIIGSHSVSTRRIAALSAAYSISETAVKELNDKMQDVLGEKKTTAIKEAIAKDKVSKNPVPEEKQIIMTGDGDVLCMDGYSGRYFRSNAQKLGQAINELNSDVQTDMYVSLNELYDLIGIPRIPLGDDIGWNIEDTNRGLLPISYAAVLTPDNTPCLCLEYDAKLRTDYRNLH